MGASREQGDTGAVFLGRRRLLKGAAAGSILASGLGAVIFAAHTGTGVASQMAALPAEDDPSAGLYPAKRNRGTRSTGRSPTRNSRPPTTTSTSSVRRNRICRSPGTEDPAVDDQDRRHGREADDHRHRRSVEADAARGKALPPPLRRSLVDGGAVERLPDGRLRGYRKAAGLGEICPIWRPFSTPRSRPARKSSGIPGPMSRA